MAKRKTKPANESQPLKRAAENLLIHPALDGLAVPIAQLVLDPDNARKHDQANVDAIAGSLAKFGQRTPIVVNRLNQVVEKGNGTLLAARQLGWERLAVVYVTDDPATQLGYAIADNRTAELATWDDDVFVRQLQVLAEEDAALFAALQGQAAIDERIDEAAGDGEESGEAEPEAADAQTVPDMWQIVVTCDGEQQQAALFDELKQKGLKVRLLTL